MTWYRRLDILQEPFDGGADQVERSMYRFNVMGIKGASDTFLEELASLLVTANVGVLGKDIFLTTAAHLPIGDGPFLNIVETGGTGPEHTQNSTTVPAYQRPAAQITTRARSSTAARAMSRRAYNALVMVRNRNVTA